MVFPGAIFPCKTDYHINKIGKNNGMAKYTFFVYNINRI
jgi:hypothetical protein